jgi:hypothetical protein
MRGLASLLLGAAFIPTVVVTDLPPLPRRSVPPPFAPAPMLKPALNNPDDEVWVLGSYQVPVTKSPEDESGDSLLHAACLKYSESKQQDDCLQQVDLLMYAGGMRKLK